MAECKEINTNKPDYQLTLSWDERVALKKLLDEQSTYGQEKCGLTKTQAGLNDGVWRALKDA